MKNAPERVLPTLLTPDIELTPLERGGVVLRSRVELGPTEATLCEWLHRWADERPDGVAFVELERDMAVTWGDLHRRCRSVAQALLDRGLSLERPVMILSGNSIAHACLSLGAALAGVPVVPVSVAYSLASRNHQQLLDIAQLGTPGLVFAEDPSLFADALASLEPLGAELVSGEAHIGFTPFADLLETSPGAMLDAVQLTPDTVLKILMTSGSTGRPKGVLNTHRMMTHNQQMLAQVYPFVDERPQVLVDWLPWSHTFGGNHNFNLVLRTGGTMVIVSGRPQPGAFEPTLRALRMWSPTFHLDVPAGWALLARALETDAELRQRFFAELSGMFYAAAPLPQSTWDRLDAIALRHLGHRPWLTTGWGTTETSPMSTAAHFSSERADSIGVPAPGVEVALVPEGDGHELRVRGPHVTPGYHRDQEATVRAFDAEGFYRTGDGGELVDPDRPELGLRFAGRLVEDFKLSSGTWVHVGWLRSAALDACEGLLSHAVIAGQGRDDVTVLGWIDIELARSVAGSALGREVLNRNRRVQAALRELLVAFNTQAGGASRRIARVALFDKPPSVDAGEITDKGYVNAGAVLRGRVDEVRAALEGHGDTLIEVS